MPVSYQVKRVKITDLLLDSQNPRFIGLENNDQSSIIEYLLKSENVIDLARSISSYGGFMPGEFPIVCVENDDNIVVEGNRRICSCKILLDPTLAPAEYRASIPTITNVVRSAIKKPQVHIISSREDAQIVLGTRHIQGVKTWPSISKFTFFAKHYEDGKPINEIELLTGVKKGVITRSLKKHYFLQYILSLDCWTDLEKQNYINYASLHKIGVDRILRIFSTEGSKDLKLSYDDNYNPMSELPDFGKIVEHIVRRVLGILPGKSSISTRISFSVIREDVKQWLPPPTAPTIGTQPSRQTEFYLSNLTYNIASTTNEDRALIAVCEEVKKISRGASYRQYPLATSYLTRALIEQSCKRYLKITDSAAHSRLCSSGRDSSLGKILQHFCNDPALFPDHNYHRLFSGLLPNIKDLIDLNMHHPSLSLPTGPILESWVSAGLKNILEYLLR